VNFRATGRIFVIALVSVIGTEAACADDGGGVGDNVFNFLDKNRDGRIDADEFPQMPASFQNWLVSNGWNPEAGLKKADFLRLHPEMMKDLRRRTPTASGGSSGKSGPTKDEPNTDPPQRDFKPLLYLSEPPPDEIVETQSPATAKLPSDVQDADLNGDGQIDFYEWRTEKLGGFLRFQEIDLNEDSVLSLAELNQAGSITGASSSSSSGSTTSNGDSSRSAPARNSTTNTAQSSNPSGPSKEFVDKVKYFFTYMDKNKNEKLDPEEWEISRKIKPAFERAKVDITKPMDQKTFVAHFLKIWPNESSWEAARSGSGSSNRRSSGGGSFGRRPGGGQGSGRR